MTPTATPEFENLCDKEFELARSEAYDALDRAVAEIRARLARIGHVMSSAVGQGVLDAVLARYDRVLAGFEKVYLGRWGESELEFTDSDYEWLRGKAMSVLPREAQEAQSRCQNLLYESSLFFQPWWQKVGPEARERNNRILNKIEILKLQKAQKMASKPASLARQGTIVSQDIAVLISHSSKDKALAEALIDLLRLGLSLPANLIRCSSVDGYRLPAGVNTDDELRKEIRTARVLVGLLTPNSISSTYVLFELGARWGAGLFLVPLLAGIKPEEMRGPQSVLNALSCETEAQLIQLVEDIGKELKVEPQSATSYLKQAGVLRELAAAISPVINLSNVGKPTQIVNAPESQAIHTPSPQIVEAEPNIQTDFDSAPLGPIYLTPEGVWSASYTASGAKWSGLRLRVSNSPIEGKRVGPATGVSVRVRFEHDTGLDAACAAPTAWLHEKLGYVDLKVGDEKEAIIAVRSGQDWYTVTNVRDSSGYPKDGSAMRFQEAPWFHGKLHIAVIVNGEAVEQHYSWDVSDQSIVPRIRKISATAAV